ncbi:MAG: succinate dehydrogenase, cytochrome b556 subunit [Burkholderiaceae bacterium]|nr:MAG: succinate dehydrogenase, cytochrome b556 subunit [Burkholderiaceae bacterium]
MSDLTASPHKARPRFTNIGVLDIVRYRLPLPGKVSIFHRLSGVGMFLLLPWLLYLFEQSVTSDVTFEVFKAILSSVWVKIILLGVIWAYLHHFCAGIRFLLLDLHIGIDKASANMSAAAVFAVSVPLAVLCGLKLFGVF